MPEAPRPLIRRWLNLFSVTANLVHALFGDSIHTLIFVSTLTHNMCMTFCRPLAQIEDLPEDWREKKLGPVLVANPQWGDPVELASDLV